MNFERQNNALAQESAYLLHILQLIKSAWKTINIFVVLGIAIAIIYLLITPNRYEAVAQIHMAQVGNDNRNKINSLKANVEEPALLIARMSFPTSFNEGVVHSCGLQGLSNAEQTLAKEIKLMPIKKVDNVVELKAYGATPQIAINCANAIFELIKLTQAQLISPFIQDAQSKLMQNQMRLLSVQQMVASADKSGQAMSASYLATRDEIRYLLDQASALQDFIMVSESGAARLLAPIYASDDPVAPKKSLILLGGLLGGLFLGLLIVLALKVIDGFKSQAQGFN